MEFTRETVRLALYVTGPLVLAAYVFGISRMESPNDLWGGTHPGSGLPTILESGRITAKLVCADLGIIPDWNGEETWFSDWPKPKAIRKLESQLSHSSA